MYCQIVNLKIKKYRANVGKIEQLKNIKYLVTLQRRVPKEK